MIVPFYIAGQLAAIAATRTFLNYSLRHDGENQKRARRNRFLPDH